MNLEIYKPEFPANLYIKSIIYYDSYTAPSNYEKLIPDGNSQIIFDLDCQQRRLKTSCYETERRLEKVWVTGVQTKPVVYYAEKNARSLCVQLERGSIFSFTGIPEYELKNRFIDAELIFGTEVIELRNRLIEAESAAKCCRLAIDFILKGVSTISLEKKLLSNFRRELDNTTGPIEKILEKIPYSQKQLIQLFKKETGLTPKQYQRLMRFNRSLEYLQGIVPAEIQHIVYHCNYYDQSHFINEFREYTSYTPNEYLKMNKNYPHVIQLDHLKLKR